MPKLWDTTMDTHRQAVREAILVTTAKLVAERGVRSVTMSQVASLAGIGRATLYRYFPDLDSILRAWHERQVREHVEALTAMQEAAGEPEERLMAVLAAYASILRQREVAGSVGAELERLLHRGEHVEHAEQRLRAIVRDLLVECAQRGTVRSDVAPAELATFCLHALSAARDLRSNAAVRRLVAVTLDGLRPPGLLGASRREPIPVDGTRSPQHDKPGA